MTDYRQPWRRLSADQLQNALAEVGLSGSGLAYILSKRTDRIRSWLKGEEDPPLELDVILALLTLPGARELVLQVIRRHQHESAEEEDLLDWREPPKSGQEPTAPAAKPIAFTALPVRARNTVRYQLGAWHGDRDPSPKEVARLSRSALVDTPNCGKDTLAAIEGWLASHGHRMRP